MTALAKRPRSQAFISRPKPLWNVIAIAYTLIGYLGGLALIVQPGDWLNVVGVLLLTHSLVYSAYLAHEFMHGTIFAGRRWNSFWGTVMLWLNGGCYGGFDTLTVQHMAHHVNRIDFSGFDLAETIQALPKPLCWSLLGLEGTVLSKHFVLAAVAGGAQDRTSARAVAACSLDLDHSRHVVWDYGLAIAKSIAALLRCLHWDD